MSLHSARPASADPAYPTTRRGRDTWRELAHCPICGHRGWCRVFTDGCIGCRFDDSGVPNRAGDEWYFWPDGRPDDWRDRLARLPPPPAKPSYNPNLLDRVYRRVLARFPLNDRHRADLRAKGFPDPAIDRLAHGSLPADPAARARVVAELERELGFGLVGAVPGFIRRQGVASLGTFPESARIIPVRDQAGRIVALRFRLDDVTDQKYRWASGGLDGAAVDGATLHWAHPARRRRADVVGIAEGEDKANAIAERYGIVAIAVPGIMTIGGVPAALAALPELAHVAIFYDKERDPEKAALVETAERRLVHRVLAAQPQLSVLQAMWDPGDGKGVDDVLARGLVPLTLPHPLLADLAPNEPPADAAPARPAADDAIVRENARLRRHQQATVQTIANRNLGGDVGGKIAVLLAGELAHQAASRPAADHLYPVTGARLADGNLVVAPQTVRTYLAKWRAAGLIDTVERRETATRADGLTLPVKRTYVRFDGDATTLLERFAVGSVYADAADRPVRGGHRPRKVLPTECPACGGATVAVCTVCGTMHAAVDVDPPERPSRAQDPATDEDASNALIWGQETEPPERCSAAQARSERAEAARRDLVARETSRCPSRAPDSDPAQASLLPSRADRWTDPGLSGTG